jgi:GT2 family glycosyltransferase/glycosyltransferase involved in cell wall biosynthesis
MARLSKTNKLLRFLRLSPRPPESFNETSYLKVNPDVAAAVKAGKIRSGRAHWQAHGFAEGRPLKCKNDAAVSLPPDFDEQAYLELNPDVAIAVSKGDFASGADHYRQLGVKEHRRWANGTEIAEAFEKRSVTIQDAARRLEADPLDYGRANPDIFNDFGQDPMQLRQHWKTHGYKEGRAPYGLSTFSDRSFSRRFWAKDDAITFYGLLGASTGLGRASNHYVSIIRAAGYKISTVSVKDGWPLFETEPPTRPGEQLDKKLTANKINIFHLNADMVHRFFADDRLHLLDDSYNIGIWVWELAHFRPEWIDCCGAFDEIWVPSEFCKTAISAIVPVPVFVMPHAVEVTPSQINDPRSYFRIPKDTFVFGAYFDVGSAIERKNPTVVIDAFRSAFGDSKSETLVLKYHSSQHDPDGIKKLHEMTAGMKNVRYIGHTLSDDEVSAVRETLNCYISAHRGEGFGLNVAEAIACGTPVITTLYSGVEDFCNEDNVYPIDYRLTELASWIGPYPPGALWADPSSSSLSDLMLYVRRHVVETASKAKEARERLLDTNSVEAVAARLKQHIDSLEIFNPPPTFLRAWGAGKDSTSHFTSYEELRFSVVVPVYNIDPTLLAKCILSVREQSYRNWELILFDDGSSRTDTIEALRLMRGVDPRIKVAFSDRNRGISAATNSAIGLSSGSFLAFLDNDDEIAPGALRAMADAIARNPNVDVLYSDEDKLDMEGRRCDHYFKPDWSPEHLESVMYLLHFFVVRRSLFLEVGGLREEFSGAQDYDLALRLTRVARKVVHIPEILYHWRMIPGSAAAELNAKPKALERARLALEEHCAVLGRPADVTIDPATGLLRVQDHIDPGLPVTLLILTDNRTCVVAGRGKINLLDHFLDSIVKKTRTNCSLSYVVADNHNLTQKQVKRITSMGGKVVSYNGSKEPFNFASKANFALRQVDTEMVIMLNDDLEVITPDWVDALIGLAQRPSTGIVGAKLRFANDTIQHCGVIFGINNHVAHIYHQHPAELIGYNGYTHVIRNYLAVTGAVIAARMSHLMEVGLFDETLRVDYNDTDLCLKLHSIGYRNIYTPYAELYHFEGTSQARKEPTPADRKVFDQRWGHYLKADPFYNPNLTKHELNFRAAAPKTWDR